MNKQILISPIARAMVMKIIRHKNLINSSRDRHAIDADLVPAVHMGGREEVLHESGFVPVHQETQHQHAPIQYATKTHVGQFNPIPEGYGKLTNLMRDPYVTYIECFGPDTPLLVIKNNQRQKTNISMSTEEVRAFFDYISNKSKIPILEGVFKVVIDNNLFNAIISEFIGTKFIIKKNIQLNQIQ
jgi:hypothetical protein